MREDGKAQESGVFSELENWVNKMILEMKITDKTELGILRETILLIKKRWHEQDRNMQYCLENVQSDICNYKELSKIKKEQASIYLVFVSSPQSDLSKAIMAYTQSPYYHVAISLNEKLTNMYSFSIGGGDSKGKNHKGGFSSENLLSYKRNHSFIKVWRIFLEQAQYNIILNEISTTMRQKKMTEYNYHGLINYVLKKEVETTSKTMFCSQYIAYLLQKAGIRGIDKAPCFVSPKDLEGIELERQCIYIGDAECYKAI